MLFEPFCVDCHVYFFKITYNTFKKQKCIQRALQTDTFALKVSKKTVSKYMKS